MSKPIDTVLFDLDGTLIDTNELIISSFMHVMDHYFPAQYTRNDVLQFMGPPLVESFERINPAKVDEMVDFYRAYNLENHDLLVTGFPKVEEAVKELAERNIKMAIVSTKRNDVVIKGLKLMKLDHYFDVVVGLDDVKNAKPDPEPLLLALKRLNSLPENTIMVGDNHHDIVGGQNAGTKTAGVAWSAKGRDYLLKYKPDWILDSMMDIVSIISEPKK
ncbi:pyrophosphatase PpaX [Jeotgalibacillus proteolyticus]|uniref:Pyrophosphatase PpaX n=1 Tax=Jeotgalibacillus proteolyticus TaxID=2082395 RepID=A0A2S5GBC7_9BACL|nr:pyrophosphatase PpaX [Jeotgalibacillus proteolyticus]PPA70203.1 pyrophosphatase PpaX [Jeotgalibacillus proteolyticus]